jgi:hypothetical protein
MIKWRTCSPTNNQKTTFSLDQLRKPSYYIKVNTSLDISALACQSLQYPHQDPIQVDKLNMYNDDKENLFTPKYVVSPPLQHMQLSDNKKKGATKRYIKKWGEMRGAQERPPCLYRELFVPSPSPNRKESTFRTQGGHSSSL